MGSTVLISALLGRVGMGTRPAGAEWATPAVRGPPNYLPLGAGRGLSVVLVLLGSVFVPLPPVLEPVP